MTSMPENYNSSQLGIDPITMNSSSQKANEAAQNISTALGEIMKCLSELRISWTGDSADQADDFNQRWTSITSSLYGSEASQVVNILSNGALYAADPALEGVLPVLNQGVTKAADNYAGSEGAVKAMFESFSDGLTQSGSSGGSPTSDAPSGSNWQYHTTAVNETAS